MAAVMSLSAHFPVLDSEPAAGLRNSSLLSASGSIPLLASLFVEEAVTEIAVRLTLSQSILPPVESVDERTTAPAHVNPPKPVAVAEEDDIEPRDIYDGLDEEDYDEEEDDVYGCDEIEFQVLGFAKAHRRHLPASKLSIRTTKDNKNANEKPNKRYGHRYVAKVERSKTRKMENALASKSSAPARVYIPSSRAEERDLEEALRRSRRQGHVSNNISVSQLMDLQNRELTPEDYELLLMLDETVQKKTVSKDTFSSFEKVTLTADLDVDCPVCMSPMVIGEKVTTLPCKHQYHTPCIEQWLTLSSPNCPLDGLSLLHDH